MSHKSERAFIHMRLVHKWLYRLGEVTRGWDIQSRIDQLQEMERFSAEDLKSWQLEKLQQLVLHAYTNIPFYRNLWDRNKVKPEMIQSLDDLKQFPCVTKQDLMEAGDLALDSTKPKSSFVQGRSSGSTGKRFVYYKNKEHHSWFIASGMLPWIWGGWNLGDRWVRLQFRGELTPRQKIEDWVFNCLYMPIDKMDDSFMKEYADRIARFKPRMFRGYAGGTYVFARYLLENNDKRIRPESIMCTGDTLYPHYRSTIEKAFDCPVFDSYGGEGMSVACQCEKGTYHILPPVHLELEDISPIENDQPGAKILLTSLTNYAMPMIRYDIADVAVACSGDCPCNRKWPTLKKIVGRQTDIVVTPAGHNLVCHHFNNVMRNFDCVDQFQVIQQDSSSINLRLQVNKSYDQKRDHDLIVNDLLELTGKGLKVNIEIVNEIPLPASGKRRYIISNVGNNQQTKDGQES